MSTSQPIALPATAHSPDHPIALGSYTSPNGAFNPASYTRHFLGSPLSWRGGSFGGRLYNAGSPDQLIGPLDQNDFKCGKLSSSIESDRGSIVNAFNVFEGELCRNYSCCGLNLTDLHALLEHFEEVHVVVVDPSAPQPHFASQYTAQPHIDHIQPLQHFQNPQSHLPSHPQGNPPPYIPEHHNGPFDPDDMELDLETMASTPSSGAPTPPDTPLSTPLSSYPSPSGYTHSHLPHHAFPPSFSAQHSLPGSSCASPHPHSHVLDSTPVSAFETTVVRVPSVAHRAHTHSHLPLSAFPPSRASPVAAPDAFNAYAGYSDYSSSMPGTVPSPPASILEESPAQGQAHLQNQTVTVQIQSGSDSASQYTGCVPPALLFSNAGSTPVSTPTTSRGPSPTTHSTTRDASTHAHAHAPAGTSRASSTLSRPASSLLLNKPFRCPKPNCSKSYKQANGLKYHMTHGSCNFAPPKDLEHVQALLASKRSARAGSGSGSGSGPASPISPQSPAASGRGDPGAEPNVDATGLGLGMITEHELREVEREAERQLRPFACGVGDCQRRYKNMNGLRYHYQHSGEHGAHGLALLMSGAHECLSGGKSGVAVVGSTQSSRHASRQGSRERGREHGSGVSTPVLQQQPQLQPHPQPQPQAQPQPPQYSQQQQSYAFTAQQQAQLAYQQQFAHHQRAQYQQQQAQAQAHAHAQLSNMGMYMAGMDFTMAE